MNCCHTLKNALRMTAKCHGFALSKTTKQLPLSLCAYPKINCSARLQRAGFKQTGASSSVQLTLSSTSLHILHTYTHIYIYYIITLHIGSLKRCEQGTGRLAPSTEFQLIGVFLLGIAELIKASP